MKFFYHLLSQPCRALQIFLKMSKIPYEPVVVDLKRGEHFTEEFKRINRFQKVPCIIDESEDDFKLSETIAIFRYLIKKNPQISDNWYPSDLRKRALVDEYLEWQHNNTRLFGMMFFRTKYLEPKITKKPPNEKKIQMYFNGFQQTLDTLDSVWLESRDKKYLATKELSFADLLCAAEIEQTRIENFDPFEGRPRLKQWWLQVKKDTDPYYDEAHEVIYQMLERNRAKL